MTFESVGVISSILISVFALYISVLGYRRDGLWRRSELRQAELDRLEAAYWELDALLNTCVRATHVEEAALPDWTFRQPTTRKGPGNALLNGAALKVYDLWVEVALREPGEVRVDTLKGDAGSALAALRSFIVDHRGDW